MKIRTCEKRIAITGLAASGKTVFLTSLINHLKEQEPERFRLGKNGNAVILRFRELEPDSGWSQFEYELHRESLVNSYDWPEKTKDRNEYVCAFERSDWHLCRAKLKFYDMPGERLADAIMFGMEYDEWSDHVLKLLEANKDYREDSRQFLELLHCSQADTQALIRAYRSSLANLILQYKPYISPSTLVLSPEGKVNKRRSAGEMATDPSFFVGKDQDNEFVPLPVAFRSKQPEITKSFVQRYQAYRNEIVLPVLRALKSCHAVIILVDVGMLLAGGVGMYNDNRQMLVDLLDVLQPGQSLLGRVIRKSIGLFLPHGWRPGRITRIAVAATKLDLVHPEDRDHMISLPRHMIGRRLRNYRGLTPDFFNCSAIVSALPLPLRDGQRWMSGFLVWDSETGAKRTQDKLRDFKVPELPAEWPKNWRQGKFSFADVYPPVPQRHDCAPDQVNLDRIFDFIMR